MYKNKNKENTKKKKTIPIKKCRGVFAWEKDEA